MLHSRSETHNDNEADHPPDYHRQHAIKHACYASQLQITVRVRDNRTDVIVLELPPIDTAHAEKPRNKRDKTYRRLAKKAKKAKK